MRECSRQRADTENRHREQREAKPGQVINELLEIVLRRGDGGDDSHHLLQATAAEDGTGNTTIVIVTATTQPLEQRDIVISSLEGQFDPLTNHPDIVILLFAVLLALPPPVLACVRLVMAAHRAEATGADKALRVLAGISFSLPLVWKRARNST